MADSFREVSNEGFFSRLKGAIGGVLVGLAMFIGAFPLQFWNEGRAVTRTRSLEEGQGAVLSVPGERVETGNEGKLIHVAGRVVASSAIVDQDFGLTVDALGLRRKVEMYQWREKKETRERKKLGGGTEKETIYTYERAWDDEVIDSSDFREPSGHGNPGQFPISGERTVAASGKLGAYTLDREVLELIDEWDDWKPPTDANQAPEGFQRTADGWYRGADPDSPAIGDVRVRFDVMPEGDYSFVAQQRGDGLVAYQTKAGDAIMLIGEGIKTAPEMFATAHRKNTLLTWALRAGGFFLMWMGLALVLKPFAVLGDVIPFVGSIVGIGIGLVTAVLAFAFSLGTIAVAWIFYRPVLGIGLLVVAAGAFFLLKRKRGTPPPAPAAVNVMPPPPPPARR